MFIGLQNSAIINHLKMMISATDPTKPYIYNGHSKVPKNVTHVIVHESVTVIPDRAFCSCCDLKKVVLPEGLIEIRDWAFESCRSLKDINFPSTLRSIGARAFGKCYALARVDFNEGLQMIGEHAFYLCRSILHLQIPSTITTFGRGAFVQCWALKDVRLCEGLLMIGPQAFSCCYSLLRINIPSSVTIIGYRAFYGCNFLRNVVIAPDATVGKYELEGSLLLESIHEVGCSLDLLKGRFNDLPLHRICFHQTTSGTLLEEVKEHATNENLTQQDCLEMMPLHILACSGRHDIEVYKFFVSKYPEALLVEDIWDETPLAYAILGEAPQEIIHFLFEKHSKSLTGSLPFDFLVMVEKLTKKKGSSAKFLGSIIQAQRTHFPTLEIEWGRIVNENIKYYGDNDFYNGLHFKIFRVLVEASVSKRSNCMSSEHRLEIDSLINEIDARQMRRGDGQQIIDLVQDYAQQYREFLKEATTMLELALWKFAIDESENSQDSNEERDECQKVTEIDSTESRRQCRIKCNAEDIFPIILSFL